MHITHTCAHVQAQTQRDAITKLINTFKYNFTKPSASQYPCHCLSTFNISTVTTTSPWLPVSAELDVAPSVNEWGSDLLAGNPVDHLYNIHRCQPYHIFLHALLSLTQINLGSVPHIQILSFTWTRCSTPSL